MNGTEYQIEQASITNFANGPQFIKDTRHTIHLRLHKRTPHNTQESALQKSFLPPKLIDPSEGKKVEKILKNG